MKPAPNDMEVLIDEGRTVTLQGEPQNCFAVISSLKANGFTPQIRTFDENTQDWGEWQTVS